jgi:DNA-binding response OmpR family regulator
MENEQQTQIQEQAPILVVDDDQQLCQTISLMLEEEGFTAHAAADGREAIELLSTLRPALVLLDKGLPLMDGEQVAQHIRALYALSVPIILMTADGQATEMSQRIGAVSYLRKPFDFDELISQVQQACKL